MCHKIEREKYTKTDRQRNLKSIFGSLLKISTIDTKIDTKLKKESVKIVKNTQKTLLIKNIFLNCNPCLSTVLIDFNIILYHHA